MRPVENSVFSRGHRVAWLVMVGCRVGRSSLLGGNPTVGCFCLKSIFLLQSRFYSEVDVFAGCTKLLKNLRWRAPARIFALFCAALQNIDFRIKTVTSKKRPSTSKKKPPWMFGGAVFSWVFGTFWTDISILQPSHAHSRSLACPLGGLSA